MKRNLTRTASFIQPNLVPARIPADELEPNQDLLAKLRAQEDERDFRSESLRYKLESKIRESYQGIKLESEDDYCKAFIQSAYAITEDGTRITQDSGELVELEVDTFEDLYFQINELLDNNPSLKVVFYNTITLKEMDIDAAISFLSEYHPGIVFANTSTRRIVARGFSIRTLPNAIASKEASTMATSKYSGSTDHQPTPHKLASTIPMIGTPRPISPISISSSPPEMANWPVAPPVWSQPGQRTTSRPQAKTQASPRCFPQAPSPILIDSSSPETGEMRYWAADLKTTNTDAMIPRKPSTQPRLSTADRFSVDSQGNIKIP